MNQLAERESWPGEAMARLLVDAGADVAREPIRALMLSLAPAKIPPLLPWLSHVDAVLGSEVAVELLRRHPDDMDIAAAALLVVTGSQAAPGVRALRGRRGCRRAPESRRRLRPARLARRRRAGRAAHVRPRLVGALSRGPGAAQAQGHDGWIAWRRSARSSTTCTRATCSSTCARRRRADGRPPSCAGGRAVGVPRLLHPAERDLPRARAHRDVPAASLHGRRRRGRTCLHAPADARVAGRAGLQRRGLDRDLRAGAAAASLPALRDHRRQRRLQGRHARRADPRVPAHAVSPRPIASRSRRSPCGASTARSSIRTCASSTRRTAARRMPPMPA